MRLLLTSSALTLLLFFSSTSSASTTNSSSAATACPYDIDHASTMIPPACYANYTAADAAVAPPTNCCWFVFAAYIYAAIRYSNATGEAFLPDPAASACSSALVTTLIRRGLAVPSLLLSGDRCNISSSGLAAGAGKLPCLYPTITALRSAVNLSSAVRSCSSPGVPDLLSDGRSCKSCQNSVIAATITLLGVTNSKEFVPCGMATTIGVWSTAAPDIRRFRSYALCMVQVLENVGTLGTGDLIPSPPPPPPSPPTAKSQSDSTPLYGFFFFLVIVV
ncbi:hypothetical protein QJS10_CPB21g01763 [Acorus calamus]|uniref:SPARK domain-containing protein n=1 Tax=Acorus calamus TaxID=4465 RepID=A0AAV9C5J5_ACOCL|nr:hypothetical protein QJS10_CPB21g01763 [Acorus calamus]